MRGHRSWTAWVTVCAAKVLIFAAPMVLSGEARAQVGSCPITTSEDLQKGLNSVGELIELVDYEGALAALAELESRLPCTQGPVNRDTLTQMYVYRGLTLFYLNRLDPATIEFSKALAVNPTYQWNPSLGQRPRALFDKAHASLLNTPMQTVKAPALKPSAEVFINGERITSGQTVSLVPGQHLLQVKLPSGEWSGNIFPVTSGVEYVLPIPREVIASSGSGDRPATGGGSDTGGVRQPPPSGNEPASEAQLSRYESARRTSTRMAIAGAGAVLVGGVSYGVSSKLLYGNYYQGVDAPGKSALFAVNWVGAFAVDSGVGLAVLGAGGSLAFWLLSQQEDKSVAVAPWISPESKGVTLALHF